MNNVHLYHQYTAADSKTEENEPGYCASCFKKIFIFSSGLWGQLFYCLLHSIVSIVLFTMRGADDGVGKIQLYISTFKNSSGPLSIPEYSFDPVWTINLYNFIGYFLLITSIAHFSYLLSIIYKWEDVSIRYRWFEYGVSASIMIVIISILTSIRDVLTLLAMFFLTASTMIFGYQADSYYRDNLTKTFWFSPFWLGMIPYLPTWVILFIRFYRALNNSLEKPPDIVYAIIIIMFFLFSSFAVIQFFFIIFKAEYNIGISEEDMGTLKKLTKKLKIDVFSVLSKEEHERRKSILRMQDGALHFLSFAAKFILAMMVFFGIEANN